MLWLGFLSFCALGVSVAASVTSGILGVDLLPREQNSTTALIDCLTTAGLEPVTPSHPAYQNDSLPVNTRLIYQPAALVYPNTTEDVSAAIKCGAANDVKVNARSGGHSCTFASETLRPGTEGVSLIPTTDASFSTGGEDGHLIISLDHLNNMTMSGDYVTVGTGTTLGPLYYFLWKNGQSRRALTVSVCQCDSYRATQVNALWRSALSLRSA